MRFRRDMSPPPYDMVRFRGKDYAVIGARGPGLFDPAQVGIKSVSIFRGFEREFFCTYEIDDDGIFLTNLVIRGENESSYPRIGRVEPTFDNSFNAAQYSKIRLPVPFHGGLLLGGKTPGLNFNRAVFPLRSVIPVRSLAGFNVELPDYEEIRECLFKRGELDRDADHSARCADLEKLTRVSREDLIECFRLDYGEWGISWIYEGARGLGRYSLPPAFEEKLQAVEDSDRRVRERLQEQEEQAAESERIARQLFARIERDGWDCTHCGRHGVAHEDFRLSIGPASCVICRKCGWVQELKQEP
jgi:hypothetical protein